MKNKTVIMYLRFSLFREVSFMLGKLVRVCITDPIGSPLPNGNTYKLNHGKPIGKFKASSPVSGVFILGIDNPVKHFDGRVVAIIKFRDNGEQKLVASPKSKPYINCEIDEFVKFYTDGRPYSLDCFYERSCGAVVFRKINEDYRYLLIRNRRSSNWSFPKGHVESGETHEETAKREVLEETGLHINIIPGFVSKSQYSIQNRIQKTVNLYVATTNDSKTKIQVEEIEDYVWLTYDNALKNLKFENDKTILTNAHDFLLNNKYITEV